MKLKSLLISICSLFIHIYSIAQDDPLTFFNKGIESANAKEYRKALELYDKAISLDPNLYYIYASRAESKTEIGDFKGAIDDYNQYKKLVEELNLLGDPEVLEKRQKLLTLLPSSNTDTKSENPNDGSLFSNSDLNSTNSDLKALYFRGKLKFESGDNIGALRDFNTALAQDTAFIAALVASSCFVSYTSRIPV